MTTFIFANNAKSTLSSGISSTATSVTLATGSGSLFPSPTSGQQFTLTLTDAATGSINEICYCTGRSSDTLTIVRGQEGTTARAWLSGDIAANKITAGTATSFSQGGSGGTASNIANGAANQIVYQTAANTTSFITAPTTSSTYLQWTGSGFAWNSSTSGGPTLTSNNAWTGNNTFAFIGPSSAGGASLGSVDSYWNTTFSTVFQCVTPSGSPAAGAAFFEEIYGGSNYGFIGGDYGQILGYGGFGSPPTYTNVAIADINGFYPGTSGVALGISGLPWGTVTATNGSFSGNVSGTWNGSTISISKGGTGLNTTPSNGQLLIGNGSGYSLANLTAGSNVTITNSSGNITISSSGTGSGPSLSSNNAWTGNNTFAFIGPSSAGGASLGSVASYWNTTYSTIFQCVTPSGSPTSGAAFFEQIISGSNYGFIGGNAGSILGYGGLGSPPTYTNVAIADSNGFYPGSGGTSLGISSAPWGTVNATTGSFSGNVSGTWNGNTVSVSKGGTGLNTTPSNGQILIGNGSGYSLSTLTAGSGISISNGYGSVTISGGGVTSISATSPLSASSSTGSVNLSISNVPLLSSTNAYSGQNNFGSGTPGYSPPSSPYLATIYSNAANTTSGIALVTAAYYNTQSNWDAIIASSTQTIASFSQGSPGGGLTTIGSITWNGTNTVYGTTSDRRLKDNIENLTSGTGLTKIGALQPRSFNWKISGISDVGFIADEVQAIVPSAVSGEPDAVREDGSVKAQTIDPSLLVVYLVQAVQELAAEVAALKGKA